MHEAKLITVFVIILKATMSGTQPLESTYSNLLAKGCKYNVLQEDDLTYTNGSDYSFPENCIFFAETSCKGGLTFRQACSVESTARAHPTRQIIVLFTVPVTKDRLSRRPFNALFTYPNIRFFRIILQNFGKGTPLDSLIKNELPASTTYVHHAADVLRFLTLYKFGGIFIDLDLIVVKPFDALPQSKINFIGREDDDNFAVGVVAFSSDHLGRTLANESVDILNHEFNPYEWEANGIEAFKKALNKLYTKFTLNVHSVDENLVLESSDSRLNFTVYQANYFYPIHYSEYSKYFSPGNLNLTNVFAAHVWNSLSLFKYVTEDSVYAKLAKKYCPRTITLYRFLTTSKNKADRYFENKLQAEKLKWMEP